jgi:large subunit ribosomal protein L13
MVMLMKIVDGENLILGRASANVAKLLMNGEEVAVVNAEKIVVSGNIAYITEKYRKRRDMKSKANPEHSPKWPRRPDLFVRRIVRGMLPFGYPRGRAAFKRLSVYIGVPEGLEGEKVKFPGTDAEKLDTKYHTVQLLCSRLGFKG